MSFPELVNDSSIILLIEYKQFLLSLQFPSKDTDRCPWWQQPHPAGMAWKPFFCWPGEANLETGGYVHTEESVPDARRFGSAEGREGKLWEQVSHSHAGKISVLLILK